MKPELQRKIDFAIKLLRSIPTDDGPVEISYSGGKDSDVNASTVSKRKSFTKKR